MKKQKEEEASEELGEEFDFTDYKGMDSDTEELEEDFCDFDMCGVCCWFEVNKKYLLNSF